jgi:pimeloyl-ACP methyl ester carboxylesterase
MVSPDGLDSRDKADNKAPPIRKYVRELLSFPSVLTSGLRSPVKVGRSGNGKPVLVIPGFLAGDVTTSRMRRSLATAGYITYGWGQGTNIGMHPGVIEALDRKLERVAKTHGQKVTVVGWSLGGLFAREIAKRSPENVAKVVTLCSPFSGNPRANNAWPIYQMVTRQSVDQLARDFDVSTKPPVPTVAAWSASDGIVAPAAARGLPAESDYQIEWHCTHFGLGNDPACLVQLAELLSTV